MDYPEYERMQELASAGNYIFACMRAIFEDAGSSHHPNLACLQNCVYSDTEAGITISFQLDDGTYVWVGDKNAGDASLVPRVRQIGFSSIVEGSDAEVPLRWLNLLDEQFDTTEKAVSDFNRLVDETNEWACQLWQEEHDEDPEPGPTYDVWIAEPDAWAWQSCGMTFSCDDDPDGRGARAAAHDHARYLRRTYPCAFVAARAGAKGLPLPIRLAP